MHPLLRSYNSRTAAILGSAECEQCGRHITTYSHSESLRGPHFCNDKCKKEYEAEQKAYCPECDYLKEYCKCPKTASFNTDWDRDEQDDNDRLLDEAIDKAVEEFNTPDLSSSLSNKDYSFTDDDKKVLQRDFKVLGFLKHHLFAGQDKDVEHEQVSSSTTEELLARLEEINKRAERRWGVLLYRQDELREFQKIQSELWNRAHGKESKPFTTTSVPRDEMVRTKSGSGGTGEKPTKKAGIIRDKLDKYSMERLLDTMGITIREFMNRSSEQREQLLDTAHKELERLSGPRFAAFVPKKAVISPNWGKPGPDDANYCEDCDEPNDPHNKYCEKCNAPMPQRQRSEKRESNQFSTKHKLLNRWEDEETPVEERYPITDQDEDTLQEIYRMNAKQAGSHPKHPEAEYDPMLSDENVAGFTDVSGEQYHVPRKKLPEGHPHRTLNEDAPSDIQVRKNGKSHKIKNRNARPVDHIIIDGKPGEWHVHFQNADFPAEDKIIAHPGTAEEVAGMYQDMYPDSIVHVKKKEVPRSSQDDDYNQMRWTQLSMASAKKEANVKHPLLKQAAINSEGECANCGEKKFDEQGRCTNCDVCENCKGDTAEGECPNCDYCTDCEHKLEWEPSGTPDHKQVRKCMNPECRRYDLNLDDDPDEVEIVKDPMEAYGCGDPDSELVSSFHD